MKTSPLDWRGCPDTIGRLVLFLASEQVDYVTGYLENINSGWQSILN